MSTWKESLNLSAAHAHSLPGQPFSCGHAWGHHSEQWVYAVGLQGDNLLVQLGSPAQRGTSLGCVQC
jgi:hypothetical protein